jgi:Flp pilus assembly protein TadB
MEKEETNFLIENQDLIGAINSALSRGQNLKDTMLTLYNAGYDKLKIEEAAKMYIELSRNPAKAKMQLKKVDKKLSRREKRKGKKPKEKKKFLDQAMAEKAKTATPNFGSSTNSKKTDQNVSKYEHKPKKIKSKANHTSNIVTFLLVFILIFLVLGLISVVLFKTELVEFFNRLFT